MKNTNEIIGRMIRNAREKRQMTQKELATELGYTSPQFVSLFERGFSKVPYSTLGKIAKILSISKKSLVDVLVNEFEISVQHEMSTGKKAR